MLKQQEQRRDATQRTDQLIASYSYYSIPELSPLSLPCRRFYETLEYDAEKAETFLEKTALFKTAAFLHATRFVLTRRNYCSCHCTVDLNERETFYVLALILHNYQIKKFWS